MVSHVPFQSHARATVTREGIAEAPCEVCDNGCDQLPPAWKGDGEIVRWRRADAADAIRKFDKIPRGQHALFQEVEDEGIHRRPNRLHGVEGEGISVALIRMHAQLRGF